MGAYHLSLFMLLKKDKSSLYFGIISIVLAIRTLLTGEHYLYTILPSLSYTIGLKIEYLTLYLGTPIFLEFVFKLYYYKKLNYIRKILLGLCIFLSFLILITPPIFFTNTLPLMQFIVILTIILVIGILIYSIKLNKEGARVFLLGFFIFSIIIINDLLYNNHIINTGYYSSFGLVIFIFSQAYILTSRFSGAFHKIEDLSKNLEKKVEERTLNLENEMHKTNVLNRMISVVIQSNSNREILNNIYELLNQNYSLDSFLLYMLNESKDRLVYYSKYGKVQFPKEIIDSIKNIEINENDEGSVHFVCVRKKRSIFGKNIRVPHPCKKEDEIIDCENKELKQKLSADDVITNDSYLNDMNNFECPICLNVVLNP
jgi:regulator of replication initiation timing